MKLGKSFCFMFLSVFLALTVYKHTFLREDIQSILSIKLCATNLRTRAKQKQKIVHCHGQFNIDCDNIALAFESFKVSKPVLRLTTVEGTNILC